jgi:hypothetical protein
MTEQEADNEAKIWWRKLNPKQVSDLLFMYYPMNTPYDIEGKLDKERKLLKVTCIYMNEFTRLAETNRTISDLYGR